jgi:hypothetical protein
MVSGFVPYSFVKRILTRCPPTLTRTIWRMVSFSKEGVAGNGPAAGPGGNGAAPHVCTHCAAWTAVHRLMSSEQVNAETILFFMIPIPPRT